LSIIIQNVKFLSHSAHSLRPSSTQPQPAQPVQNTVRGSTRSCSSDDGHNDPRNMLRLELHNKHRISCILLVFLSSPYVHDSRSQDPKISIQPYLDQKNHTAYGSPHFSFVLMRHSRWTRNSRMQHLSTLLWNCDPRQRALRRLCVGNTEVREIAQTEAGGPE